MLVNFIIFDKLSKLYMLTEARKVLRTTLARSPASYSERPQVAIADAWKLSHSQRTLGPRTDTSRSLVPFLFINIAERGAQHSKAKCINFGLTTRRPQDYVGRRPTVGGFQIDGLTNAVFGHKP